MEIDKGSKSKIAENGTSDHLINEDFENSDEKIICMTKEEITQYLINKVTENMNSAANPLFRMRKRAEDLENTGKKQVEEFAKLFKTLQLLERKQEKFLRKTDILPKVSVRHACISADLPIIPASKSESLQGKRPILTKTDSLASNGSILLSTNKTSSVAKTNVNSSNIECIDLTDEPEPLTTAATTSTTTSTSTTTTSISTTTNSTSTTTTATATTTTSSVKSAFVPNMSRVKHPAPLPPMPSNNTGKRKLPKPKLKVIPQGSGLVLQWDMPSAYSTISSFELFGYREQKNSVVNSLLWKKLGCVKALTLPMACTLSQFVDKSKYYFSVRAVDENECRGDYSDIASIIYEKQEMKK